MLHEFSLNSPKSLSSSVEKEAERATAFLKSKRLRIGEEKIASIERELADKIEKWKTQTRGLKKKLVELNNQLEGVVEETNFPFEGASNMTLHYAAGTARTFKSVFNKTAYQDPHIFVVRTPSEGIVDGVEDIETAANVSFHTDTNGLDTLKDGTIPCFRDGTLIVSGSWERLVERTNDSKTYNNASDFVSDYPDAESAGLSQEAYDGILDQFILDPEAEVRADFSYDFVRFEGPEYEIIPLARFVFYPSYAQAISRMEIYGRQHYLSENEIRTRGKRGKYYKSAVDRLFEKPEATLHDEWYSSKNFIEGLSPGRDDKKPIEVCDLVYKADLDDDGIPEKYLVTFAVQNKILLSIEPYPLRRNLDFCVAFRMVKREDRFLGASLQGGAQDLFDLMDNLHRHRNNVRMLVASPVFVAKDTYKEQIDLGRFENVIRPGLTFWVSDIDHSIKQLRIENLDQPGNSLDEENLVVRYIELAIGTTQALSGRESPNDPRAPMGKTIALLNQANQRIDDYLDEFFKSLPELAELHVALYAQYSSDGVSVTVDRNGKPTKINVPREALESRIKWAFPRRSVAFSPEYVMRRVGGLLQTYFQLYPLMVKGDTKSIEMWNRMVIASGEPDVSKLLWQQGPALSAPMGQSLQPSPFSLSSVPGGMNGNTQAVSKTS